MTISPAQFDKRLAAPELPPVVLLAGEEHLLRIEAGDRLRARARALGYTEREVHEVTKDFDWNQLSQSASAMSLFSTRRLIEMRMAGGKPGKEGSEALVEYCKRPAPDTVLVIVSETWSKSHETAWVAALERVGVAVVFWPLRREELPDWLSRRAGSLGLALTSDAIGLLIEQSEGHLLAAVQELELVRLLAGSERVDAARLQQLIGEHARFDVFKLTEAVLLGDGTRALRILSALQEEGEATPALVPWLSSQVQVVARMAREVEGGTPVEMALKRAGVRPMQQNAFRAALRRGDAHHWERRYRELADIERQGKGRASGDPWLALERFAASATDRRAAALFDAGRS